MPTIENDNSKESKEIDYHAKHDMGKPKISLVPPQILIDIAEVREFGNNKYGDSESWKKVEMHRYVDALLRHLIAFVRDPNAVDDESGIKAYKHAACNMAFICEMMREKDISSKETHDWNFDSRPISSGNYLVISNLEQTNDKRIDGEKP